jgi:hypothetical protein
MQARTKEGERQAALPEYATVAQALAATVMAAVLALLALEASPFAGARPCGWCAGSPTSTRPARSHACDGLDGTVAAGARWRPRRRPVAAFAVAA